MHLAFVLLWMIYACINICISKYVFIPSKILDSYKDIKCIMAFTKNIKQHNYLYIDDNKHFLRTKSSY